MNKGRTIPRTFLAVTFQVSCAAKVIFLGFSIIMVGSRTVKGGQLSLFESRFDGELENQFS